MGVCTGAEEACARPTNPKAMDTEPEIRPIRGRDEFIAALAVRRAVFVSEQGGPAADEPDAWDGAARHFVVLAGDRIVGTARFYHPETGLGKIGRLALLPEVRGRGWGARLLQRLLAHARSLGVREVVLDSQVEAVPFYARFGFAVEGKEFMEGGLRHRRMHLRLGTGCERP